MELTELLAADVDITSLSDEDLAARRAALKEAVTAANEGERTAETVELIKAGVEAHNAIKSEQDERSAAAAQIIADADAALAALAEDEDPDAEGGEDVDGETADGEGGGDPADSEGEGGGEPAEPPAEGAAPDAPAAPEAEVAEPLAAAAPKPKKPINKNVSVPARSRPRPASKTPGAVMVASGDVKGTPQGSRYANLDEMHAAMHAKWLSLRTNPDGLPHYIATVDWTDTYGPERTLSGGDAYEVSDKLLSVIEAHKSRQRESRALVASGGVPGPSEPNYNVLTFGQADRPLRDGLPSVLMKRGATVYNISPMLSQVTLDTALGAIGTVTSSADAGGATKDIQEIPAPTPKTVTVEAETMRWSQGNFADRFLPEWTAAFMKLGQVAFARHNDALRLADIKTNCTKYTDTPAKFGAYRDLKRAFIGQLEELEDLLREFDVPVTVCLPEYVCGMLATDLISQAPGDEAWRITEEAVRADVESWDPNVQIIWLKDSIRGRLSTNPSGQSPRTAGFDADVEWAMFPTGAFVYGDGGQLDLGILRDSNTVATNKFQTFFESWEALIPVIDPSLCFWITNSLCASGNSQAAQNVAVCSPQGS